MKVSDILSKSIKLPPSPEILPKLLHVLQDSESTYWEIAKLVHLDQSLTAQVLNWSNSGYYGYAEKSVDIEEAISRVGTKEIYKLVGIVMGKRLLKDPISFYGLDAGQLWETSLAAAFSMEALALRVGEDSNACYTIGLLHGIGKLAIGQACEEGYEKVFDLVEKENITLAEAEERVIGCNHAQVGQRLLEKWNFKSDVSEPVGYQYKPLTAQNYPKASSMMNLTHFIISGVGQNFGKSANAFEVDPNVLESLGISENDLQLILIDSLSKIEDVKTLIVDQARKVG